MVLQRGVFHANGVYTIPNTYLKGEGIGTNTFPTCAFRGFGAPQTLFCFETHLTHLAHHLGVDPLAFKMRYLAKKGDETTTNGHIIEDVKLPEMIDVITKESDYWNKIKEYKPGADGASAWRFITTAALSPATASRPLSRATPG